MTLQRYDIFCNLARGVCILVEFFSNSATILQYVKGRLVIMLMPSISGGVTYLRGCENGLCFVVVYRLSAIAVGGVGHVYPFRSCAVCLVEQLVEYAVGLDGVVQAFEIAHTFHL
mgnify:CR=1 FL=1